MTTLNLAAGSYLVTGSATQSPLIIGGIGSYATTGVAAQFPSPLMANTGSYAISGSAAALYGPQTLNATPGVYALTGVDAASNVLSSDAGSYATSGANTALLENAFVKTYTFAVFDDSCHLYASKDVGVTWLESVISPDATWEGSAMSLNDGDSDAVWAFAAEDGDYFGYSTLTETFTDPPIGVGWTKPFVGTIGAGAILQSGSFSSKANTVVICPISGYGNPFISHDYGASWSEITTLPGSVTWSWSCMSESAAYIYMLPNDGTEAPAVSTDGGATWTSLPSFPLHASFNFKRIACSADGSVVAVFNLASSTFFMYISTDYGGTWNTVDLSTIIGGVGTAGFGDFSLSPDGTYILAVYFYYSSPPYGYVCLSTDSGQTWVSLSPPYNNSRTFADGPLVCGISADGLGLSVNYSGNGLLGVADLSTDGGSTWATATFDLTLKPEGSPGGWTDAYVIINPAVPPYPPFVVPRGGYIIERLDNRIWPTIETAWCVDCGFTLHQPTPDATLTVEPI